MREDLILCNEVNTVLRHALQHVGSDRSGPRAPLCFVMLFNKMSIDQRTLTNYGTRNCVGKRFKLSTLHFNKSR